MNKVYKCQHGFTLLEVLLSIILLFIILTSFMGFFTQSAIFNKKNEQKLDYIQTAQTVVNIIEENMYRTTIELELAKANEKDAFLKTPFREKLIEKNNLEQFLNDKEVFNQFIKNNPHNIHVKLEYISSTDLIEAKIEVTDSINSNLRTETYTYIRK